MVQVISFTCLEFLCYENKLGYDFHKKYYRKNLRVILVHNAHAQDSLKLSAHETALFSEVTQELPQRAVKPKVS